MTVSDPRTSNSHFIQPADSESVIWRYLDVAKLLNLLLNQRLVFSQAARLDDPFEGALHPSQIAEIQLNEALGFDKAVTELLRADARRLARARYSYYVSCWCIHEIENAALWEIYSGKINGIAIQSRYSRLVQSLPTTCFVGQVQYVDYNETIDEDVIKHPVMWKRSEYAYENEIRAVMVDPKLAGKDDWAIEEIAAMPAIHSTAIDVEALVSSVFVSSYSSEWYFELVSDLCSKLNYSIPVQWSAMHEAPVHFV